ISSYYYLFIVFFFFSSRRRHTRCYRDWSSDVCSSDLAGGVTLSARCPAPGCPATAMAKRDDRPDARLRAAGRAVRDRQRPRSEQIGRASCRERVEVSVGEGGVKRKGANGSEGRE